MHDGTTLIVDVEQIDEKYVLSLPAEDLWVAYEVVRRHIDANGVRHYSQMTAASMTDDGYEFTFDTGDVFACASHLLKPASDTCSDASGGGGDINGDVVYKDITSFVADTEANFKSSTSFSLTSYYYMGVEVANDYVLPAGATAFIDGVAKDVTVATESRPQGDYKYLKVETGSVVQGEPQGITKWADLNGKTIYIKYADREFPASVINLYDPNDPNEDESYSPEYATYDSGTYMLDSTYDAAPAYECLRRGLPVWLRVAPESAPDSTNGFIGLVDAWLVSDDNATLTMYSGDYIVTTDFFTHDS